MDYYISVQLGELICRNKESISAPHDIFALAGTVTVDGVANGFVMPSVPVNELQRWSYNETIFDGFSKRPSIDLALLGLDIDDNEKWVRNRKEAGEAAKIISALAAKLPPPVGPISSLVIGAIPGVVDQFVKWDENDELLDWTGSLDMSAEAAVPLLQRFRRIEVKFSGSDPVGYSDWDYSLFLTVRCTLIPGMFPQLPRKTLTPWINSSPSDWVGTWQSAHVLCTINPSQISANLLDVHVTETVNGVQSTSQTTGVGISRVFLQLAGIHEAGLKVERVGKGKKGEAGGAVWITPRLTVERVKGRTAVVTDLLAGFGNLDLLGAGGKLVKPKWAKGILDEPPRRKQSGSDLLELANDAVLELYHVLHDGEMVNDAQLRYMRPVANIAWRLGGAIDEMLQTKVV